MKYIGNIVLAVAVLFNSELSQTNFHIGQDRDFVRILLFI